MAKAAYSKGYPTNSSGMASNTTFSALVEEDLSCIWHPFTQAQTAPVPIAIVKAKGAYLYSETGQSYLDGIASWWVNLHGHAHPYIAEKIAMQATELEHVMFAGYTHPQAVVFAQRLLALFSQQYARVFYSDNGSTAVEAALKMAFQVQGNGKRLLCFKDAYHGDTFGAMSAAGQSHYHKPFWPYLFKVHAILPPLFGREEEAWQEFEAALATGEIGAFIFEPLLQGVGGMRSHCCEWLSKMLQRCHQEGIITIADEVMTGFGRTGPLFVSSQLKEIPDLLCLSKAITGGFLPLGATLAKKYIFDAFLSPDPARAFLHGHSYSANPLACAAANASLDLLLDPACAAARTRIEKSHQEFQKIWKAHPKLIRCDVVGTILVLEYRTEHPCYHHPLKLQLTEFFKTHGVLLRPFGNILHVLPPYCITQEELQKIYKLIQITLEEWS